MIVLRVVSAVLPVAVDAPGLALLATAGLVWTGALLACTAAPLVGGRKASLNETAGTALSMAAVALSLVGVVMILLQAW